MLNFHTRDVVWITNPDLVEIPSKILDAKIKKVVIGKLDFTLLPELIDYNPKYFIITCQTDDDRLLYFLKILLCHLSVPVFVFVKKYTGSLNFIKFLHCSLIKVYEVKRLDYRKVLTIIGKELTNKLALGDSITIHPKFFLNNYLKVIAIGASAGGPSVVHSIVKQMPLNSPPVIIAQHMPESFTEVFVRNLNRFSNMNVTQAQAGEIIKRGNIYVIPGNKSMVVSNVGTLLKFNLLNQEDKIKYTPSIDMLFESVATAVGRQSLGIILSGIGNDGVRGLKLMKAKGALTIAQDASSAAVFGMPKAAISENAAKLVLTTEEILIFVKYLSNCKK